MSASFKNYLLGYLVVFSVIKIKSYRYLYFSYKTGPTQNYNSSGADVGLLNIITKVIIKKLLCVTGAQQML